MKQLSREFQRIKNKVVKLFPELEAVKLNRDCLEVKLDHLDSPRQYAHTHHYPYLICVTPEIKKLPLRHIQGLLWHEFGHIIAGKDKDECEADSVIYTYFGIEIKYSDDELELQYI